MRTKVIKRPPGSRFVVQNTITLDVDVIGGQLEIRAEAPEGVKIEDQEFDHYTSIDTEQPRYSIMVSHPDRRSRQLDNHSLGELIGDLIRELEEDPEATITIKTSVSK
ncbi:MAG: hypothetical protein AB2784_21890 [Candidatus Thiodiazotropha endolucinida]